EGRGGGMGNREIQDREVPGLRSSRLVFPDVGYRFQEPRLADHWPRGGGGGALQKCFIACTHTIIRPPSPPVAAPPGRMSRAGSPKRHARRGRLRWGRSRGQGAD